MNKESEKLKEQLLNNFKTNLITLLPDDIINNVIIIISKELQNVILSEDKELPSAEVINNDKICNTYLASKKLKDLVTIQLEHINIA